MDYNCLCNFGRGHYEEKLFNCFEFGPEVEMLFKDFSFFSSGINFVMWSRPICETLLEGIMGNNKKKIGPMNPGRRYCLKCEFFFNF